MKDWDDAYANMAHIPGSEALPAQWAADAAAYRASGISIDEDVAYGDAPRQKLDLIWPDATPKGLAVFVHGGYWMKLCKSDWTHFAEGARASGWAVAMTGYTLAPDAQISDMTQETAKAVDLAATRVDGPIRLAGHSAGGHLVSRLACTDLALGCADRITQVLSISGLHDLRPLLRTKMNDTLGLTLESARSESPALLEPRDAARVTAWVGGGERPEFIRQARLLENIWSGFDVEISAFVDGTHDHFSVIDGLKDPHSAITQAFVGD